MPLPFIESVSFGFTLYHTIVSVNDLQYAIAVTVVVAIPEGLPLAVTLSQLAFALAKQVV